MGCIPIFGGLFRKKDKYLNYDDHNNIQESNINNHNQYLQKNEMDSMKDNSSQIIDIFRRNIGIQNRNQINQQKTKSENKFTSKKCSYNQYSSFTEHGRHSNSSTHVQQIKQPYIQSDFICQTNIGYGIQNLGNTCYINAALQMLRQIYEQNEYFLEQNSYLAQNLKQFFITLNQGSVDQQLLNYLIREQQDMQQQQIEGGDSYLAVLNYLSKINNQIQHFQPNQINEINLSQFQQIFTIVYQDGLTCSQCSSYLVNSFIDCPYFHETASSKDYLNFPKYTLQSIYEGFSQNYKCKKENINTNFKPSRTIIFYPEFLIVGQSKQQYTKGDKKIELIFGQIKYQLIGFCNYNRWHYTYTVKNGKSLWITYNDSRVYQSKLDLSYSLFQLYQKVQMPNIQYPQIKYKERKHI